MNKNILSDWPFIVFVAGIAATGVTMAVTQMERVRNHEKYRAEIIKNRLEMSIFINKVCETMPEARGKIDCEGAREFLESLKSAKQLTP